MVILFTFKMLSIKEAKIYDVTYDIAGWSKNVALIRTITDIDVVSMIQTTILYCKYKQTKNVMQDKIDGHWLTVLLSLMTFDYPDYHLWYPQTYFCRTNKDMSDDCYWRHGSIIFIISDLLLNLKNNGFS